ncbi:hypothetical protein ACFU5Y_01020 [Streptomyces gardneri]
MSTALDAMDAARAALEDVLYPEFPQTAKTAVYYPRSPRRIALP